MEIAGEIIKAKIKVEDKIMPDIESYLSRIGKQAKEKGELWLKK